MAVLITTRIDEELKERLDDQAHTERRTIRAVIEAALSAYFDEADREYGGPLETSVDCEQSWYGPF